MSKQQWSDDDSSDYEEDDNMKQPNRDFPPSESENEDGDGEGEEDYDMDYIRNKTCSSSSMNWSDALMKDVPKKIIKPSNIIISKTIKHEKEIIYKKREFNPRLPPPEKYNKLKHNTKDFKLNHTDFPTL